MGLADYSKNYVLVNGTTNEHIKIPKSEINTQVLHSIYLNDLLMFQRLLTELHDTDSVLVLKTYMKS